MGGILTALVGSYAAAIGDFESIATVNVGSGGVTDVTFSSIPATYTHLQLRGIAKGLAGGNNGSLGIQVNGASGSNQSPFHQLFGDGSTISAASGLSSDGYNASLVGPIASSAATQFGTFVVDILDYRNTNKLKTIRSLAGADYNGSGFISMRSTMNKDITAAITSLTIINYNSGGTAGFAQYSSFALYGMKG